MCIRRHYIFLFYSINDRVLFWFLTKQKYAYIIFIKEQRSLQNILFDTHICRYLQTWTANRFTNHELLNYFQNMNCWTIYKTWTAKLFTNHELINYLQTWTDKLFTKHELLNYLQTWTDKLFTNHELINYLQTMNCWTIYKPWTDKLFTKHKLINYLQNMNCWTIYKHELL